MQDQDRIEQDVLPESATVKPKPVDRITIGAAESVRVANWLTQIGQGVAGFLDLSKSDIVNFLIRTHSPTLSAKELKAIRANHYDPIRHINWIAPRLKEALSNSDVAQIAALQHEIRSIELSVISNVTNGNSNTGKLAPKQVRRRRKSIDKNEDPTNQSQDKTQGNL